MFGFGKKNQNKEKNNQLMGGQDFGAQKNNWLKRSAHKIKWLNPKKKAFFAGLPLLIVVLIIGAYLNMNVDKAGVVLGESIEYEVRMSQSTSEANIFVSEVATNGNIVGEAGNMFAGCESIPISDHDADSIKRINCLCTSYAALARQNEDANIQEGAWHGWISYTEAGGTNTCAVNARDNVLNVTINDKEPLILPDGTTVAGNIEGLWNGPLANPISITEYNTDKVGAVWTGTEDDGTCTLDNSGVAAFDCRTASYGHWSEADNSETGVVGNATATDSKWTKETTRSCGNSASLYCIWYDASIPDGWLARVAITNQSSTTTNTGATIIFNTSPAANCAVTLINGASSQGPDNNLTTHSFTFSGLKIGTLYYYSITCVDMNNRYFEGTASGHFSTTNISINNQSLVNLAIISDITVDGVTDRSMTINWQTNKLSTSWVYVTGRERVGNDDYTTGHEVTVYGLSPGGDYSFYVMSATTAAGSCDVGTNDSPFCVASASQAVTTLASDTTPDANIILKVNRDRVCDEWLYCNASVQITNKKKKPPAVENVCFSVGACNRLGDGGECVSIVDKGVSSQTFESPKEVSKLENLSGYNKVGVNWGYRCTTNGASCSCPSNAASCRDNKRCSGGSCARARVDGYYPYSQMSEIGLPVGIPNSGFGDGTTRPWKSNLSGVLTWDSGEKRGGNSFLRIKPTGVYSGVRTENLANKIEAATYVISFWAMTEISNGQNLLVSIESINSAGGAVYNTFDYYNPITAATIAKVPITNNWQQYVMNLDLADENLSGPLNITIVAENGDANSKEFYLDDVNMKAVLKAGDVSGSELMIARSCRMYPTQNAPACDYYDEDKGKDYLGWKGYCVEKDPSYPGGNVCLQWWPVDVISGEANIFSDDAPAGYLGRKPLYYCLESKGDYNYFEKQVAGYVELGTGTSGWVVSSLPLAQYNIYKDEIIQIRVNNIEIDADEAGENTQYDDCSVIAGSDYGMKDTSSLPRGTSAKRGTIILDKENKNYWDAVGENTICSAGGESGGGNRYAVVRCSGQGKDDDCNVVSARLVFDEHDLLTEMEVIFDDAQNDGGSAKFSSITVTYLGERCNVIAQVVTADGENKAWTKRIQKGGWNDDSNILGYQYDQDYAPYGASVTQEKDQDDPSKWESALYVTPANKSAGLQSPYQVRAGSPYGVVSGRRYCNSGPRINIICSSDNDCADKCVISEGVCNGGGRANELACTFNSQCYDDMGTPSNADDDEFGSCEGITHYCDGQPNVPCTTNGNECMVIGRCQFGIADILVGSAQCVSGGSDSLGKKCESAANCGSTVGGESLCWGIDLSKQEQAKKNIGGGWEAGKERLKNLFAKAYDVWQWQWDSVAGEMRYKKMPPEAGADWDITADGIPPTVNSIFVNDTDEYDFNIVTQGAAIMKFTSYVDPNQLPLVRYTVDWGDGTVVSETGLRIEGKNSIGDPHILVHYYKYDSTCTNFRVSNGDRYCYYSPKVQIEDNWGKCNGDGDCNSPGGWTSFAKEIRVYENTPTLAPPEISVAPTIMTYYWSRLPATQRFTITNVDTGSGELTWTISGVGGFLENNAPVGWEMTPGEGSSGILKGGKSQEVFLTISNIGDLTDDAVGYVYIISNDFDEATTTVTINLRESINLPE